MRLTMYLLSERADASRSSLRKNANVRELRVRVHPDRLIAFIMENDPKVPPWLNELKTVADLGVEHESLVSRTYGAVIFVKTDKRVLVVCFGTGFQAVEPSLIERGFGLRTTANLLEEGRVRGAETRRVASDSRNLKTLLPTDGTFSDLAVEIDEDWLRQLVGRSSDPSIATAVEGADSLRITVPDFSLSSLPDKADQVLSAYYSSSYREKFSFLGKISPLDKNDAFIQQLDKLVIQQLNENELKLLFVPRSPFSQGDTNHYELTLGHIGHYRLLELSTPKVLEVLKHLDTKKDPMLDVKVHAVNEDGELTDQIHQLKSYIQTQVHFQGKLFLLSGGPWFAVEKDFVQTIQNQVDQIEDLTDDLELPVWDKITLAKDSIDSTLEGTYNIRTANSRGYALLDKKLVVFSRYERLEICDLLTPEGQLLCVKSASNSQALSHLTAQAINSAAAWSDDRYQEKLARAWAPLHDAAKPPPTRDEAVFVLAIASSRPGPLRDSLFFFAKVQVANCALVLKRAGFRVALARIDLHDTEPEKVPRKRNGSSV